MNQVNFKGLIKVDLASYTPSQRQQVRAAVSEKIGQGLVNVNNHDVFCAVNDHHISNPDLDPAIIIATGRGDEDTAEKREKVDNGIIAGLKSILSSFGMDPNAITVNNRGVSGLFTKGDNGLIKIRDMNPEPSRYVNTKTFTPEEAYLLEQSGYYLDKKK